MPNDLELELAIRDFYVRNGEKMLRDLVIALGRDNMREHYCPVNN